MTAPVREAAAMLDASALLALMLGEPGGEAVSAWLPSARISAVNLSEVAAKLADYGVPASEIARSIADLDLAVEPFDREQALLAGGLRGLTREFGLSLGDRACLAAAMATNRVAVTADGAWAQVDPGVEVVLIR